jgi:hypothetical protein
MFVFLGMFGQTFQKASTRFFLVCLSIHPYETTQLQLDGVLLTVYTRSCLSTKFSFDTETVKNKGHLNENKEIKFKYLFFSISQSISISAGHICKIFYIWEYYVKLSTRLYVHLDPICLTMTLCNIYILILGRLVQYFYPKTNVSNKCCIEKSNMHFLRKLYGFPT